ncbi:helix-turn-helix domain-containing protein [Stenotrophomonas nematodicola]|uniref:helix-turn-helix domain-containing protein n=1 Tax=Stenotrophomonas nematodicola TaxID=2656746 RepID=UPI001290ADB7|nr:helix-turn-helix domain-containing protein [Stenotrophomonas nematodicola]
MSFEAFAWAARQRVTSTQKLVLLMLAERHNKDTGQCRPSHDTLADDCGLSRRSVIDQIQKLAQAGYITILARANGNVKLANQYLLNFHFGIQAKPKAPDHDPYLVVNDVHHGVVQQIPPVVNDVHQGGAPVAHKPGREPVTEPKSRKKRASAPAEHAGDLDFSTWPAQPSPQVLADWLQLRRKRRAPVTPTVLESFGAELHLAGALGFTVDDCLRKCCNRNWQGFEAAWLERELTTTNRSTGGTHAIRRESPAERVLRHAIDGERADATRGPVLDSDAHAVDPNG